MEDFLNILACPVCGGTLRSEGSGGLVCYQCGHVLGLEGGILNGTVEQADAECSDDREQARYYDEGAADELDKGRERLATLHTNKAELLLDCLRGLPGDPSNLSVCEVGVGTALHAAWILERHPVDRFVGLDVSRQVLRNGRSRWSRFSEFLPVMASAYALPFRGQSMDMVYFSGAMHHCASPDQAIREAGRVLKPGGQLVLCEPVWYYPTNLYYNLRIREEYGQRLLTRRALQEWCRQAALAPGDFHHFNFIPHGPATKRWAGKVEGVLRALPGLGRFSSMFLLTATKQ